MQEQKPLMMRADALMTKTSSSHEPPVLTEQLGANVPVTDDYLQFLQHRLQEEIVAEIEVLLPILISRISAEWKANHRVE